MCPALTISCPGMMSAESLLAQLCNILLWLWEWEWVGELVWGCHLFLFLMTIALRVPLTKSHHSIPFAAHLHLFCPPSADPKIPLLTPKSLYLAPTVVELQSRTLQAVTLLHSS